MQGIVRVVPWRVDEHVRGPVDAGGDRSLLVSGADNSMAGETVEVRAVGRSPHAMPPALLDGQHWWLRKRNRRALRFSRVPGHHSPCAEDRPADQPGDDDADGLGGRLGQQ